MSSSIFTRFCQSELVKCGRTLNLLDRLHFAGLKLQTFPYKVRKRWFEEVKCVWKIIENRWSIVHYPLHSTICHWWPKLVVHHDKNESIYMCVFFLNYYFVYMFFLIILYVWVLIFKYCFILSNFLKIPMFLKPPVQTCQTFWSK